jgi:pimeloyl-ACP methyl ester carboxylesterase
MSSPPILFLHGWGGSFASSFEAHGWTAAVAERTLVRMNLPGHADQTASADPEAYADLTASVAAKLPDRPIDIIGYSLGAKIAFALAIARPDAVRRLALFGVGDNLFAPEPAADAIVKALEQGVTSNTPPIARALAEYSRASGSNPFALAAVLRRRPNPTVGTEALAAFAARTLLINSADDKVAQPDEQLRKAMPGLHYVRLNGLSHIELPCAADVKRISTEFLRDETRPAAGGPLAIQAI